MSIENIPKNTKFIVVTGGVLSGLGKGIAAASIGNLLSDKYKIVPIKCDGYLNTDPGTMNPIEHGEVFVLDDGGEVDMDFGHYERFLGTTCKFKWNLTMGKVFQKINEKERRGDYLGKTVQFIPHVPMLIREWWYNIANEENADVLLIEIGGTIGDIENELYVEAARQLKREVGKDNVMYVHLTYVPIPSGVHEQKSKPTQQSVNLLREKGISPDLIVARCSEYLDDNIKKKISRFCDVPAEAVVTSVDVDTIYKIPLVFEDQGVVPLLNKKLDLSVMHDHGIWRNLVNNINKGPEVTIAICGKYTKLEDSYASIIESLIHCGSHNECNVKVKWIETTDIEEGKMSAAEALKGVSGIIVPGGFGSRGTEGKIKMIQYVRENNIPFLGICLGLQLAVAEFARNRCNLQGAISTEVDETAPHPVIDILPEQKSITEKGGTMRLGGYDAELMPGTIVAQLYNNNLNVSERHRHRYEVNPEYHSVLKENGLVLSGMSPDKKLVEFIELKDHPYFVATQAHPELKSSLLKPAPLFMGLVRAAKKVANGTQQL